MKKIIIILILINLFPSGYSQLLKGIIIDKSNNARISFATVYINGTYIGTYSDKNGNFELDISKYSSMPLTVSALGYNRETLVDFVKDKPLVIYLTPKVFELKEVVINSREQSRQRKGRLLIFREEFLGKTDNGQNCEILNEQDINFSYDEKTDTLKAFSANPLIIINMRLGYKIIYYLEKFVSCKRGQYFSYDGSVIFNKDSIADGSQKQNIERRRRYAYLGSRMHFLRELWNNNLKASGFSIINMLDESLDYKMLVTKKDGPEKFLYYPEKIGIGYYSRDPSSYIVFKKGKVFFDANGYFDPDGISWEGQMSRQRLGDLLPYEYNSN